jgi:hypothetical protein
MPGRNCARDITCSLRLDVVLLMGYVVEMVLGAEIEGSFVVRAHDTRYLFTIGTRPKIQTST